MLLGDSLLVPRWGGCFEMGTLGHIFLLTIHVSSNTQNLINSVFRLPNPNSTCLSQRLNHHFVFLDICYNFILGWWHDQTVISYFTDILEYSPNASSILSSSNKILDYKVCSLGIVFSLVEILHNFPHKISFGWKPRCFSLLLKSTCSVLSSLKHCFFKLNPWLGFPFHPPRGGCRGGCSLKIPRWAGC